MVSNYKHAEGTGSDIRPQPAVKENNVTDQGSARLTTHVRPQNLRNRKKRVRFPQNIDVPLDVD